MGGGIYPETSESWGMYRPTDWGCGTPSDGISQNTSALRRERFGLWMQRVVLVS